MHYDFQDFSIDLSEAIEIDHFNDRPHYYGVIFKVAEGKMKYQLIHNILMDYRIYIYDGEGHMKDIPFHRGTEDFLPEGVKINWKDKK